MTNLLWTFPLLMLAAILMGWAAEVTAVYLSAGIALAILALLQTAPEFAVEAVIAWSRNSHLILANLTGSLRILLGLGWPLVFLVHALTSRGKLVRSITLPKQFSVEAIGLALPLLYFSTIRLTGLWTPIDGLVLCVLYGFYLWMLNRQRKRLEQVPAEEDEPWLVQRILSLPQIPRYLSTAALFLLSGLLLAVTTPHFIDAMKASAIHFGVSQYIFIQWVAPFASELPEKVTALNWARRSSKVPFAVINIVSSVISQWTLMAGLVPLVFALSARHWVAIPLDLFQKHELTLTLAQSALAVVFLSDLKVTVWEAVGLLVLWCIQFALPGSRGALIPVYFGWAALELLRVLIRQRQLVAWKIVIQEVLRF